MNAFIGSATRSATGTGISCTPSSTSASTTGINSPSGERPSATDPSRPTAENASMGGTMLSQASRTVRVSSPERMMCPSRPGSGWLPIEIRPPAIDDTTRAERSAMVTVSAASAFDRKIRRGERTATRRWRQVPIRSSTAKTSPATRQVSKGRTSVPTKTRITSEPAHPDWFIQRP